MPRCLEWNSKRGELFVGFADGTITIWNIKSGQPIYGFKAHNSEITKLVWIEEENILISSSKGK